MNLHFCRVVENVYLDILKQNLTHTASIYSHKLAKIFNYLGLKFSPKVILSFLIMHGSGPCTHNSLLKSELPVGHCL